MGPSIQRGAIALVGITLARSIQFISSFFMIAYLSPQEIGEFSYAMFLMLACFFIPNDGHRFTNYCYE